MDCSEIAPVEPATHIGDRLEAACHGDRRPARRRHPAAQRRQPEHGGDWAARVSASMRCRPCAIAGCRCTPSASEEQEPAHDVEIEDVSVAASAAAQCAHRHDRQPDAARLHRPEGEAHCARRRQDRSRSAKSRLPPTGNVQTEPLFFPVGAAGAKSLTFAVEPLAGEENLANNAVTRPILVSDAKRRILYIEGEPRWEYKFIRRAEDDDPTVQIVSMLRTSENKIYRQGISDPGELADGFPVARRRSLRLRRASSSAPSPPTTSRRCSRNCLREYVDRRGGGILFLGGRYSLSDGGWGASSLNDLLPTFLPAGNHNFHRNRSHGRADAGGRRLAHHAAARRSGEKRRALEEADLPRRLRRPRLAQTRGHCARRYERRPPQTAAAHHPELRPRPHRHPGHRRHLALADERSTRRSVARSFLAAASALAGRRVARSRRRFDAGSVC